MKRYRDMTPEEREAAWRRLDPDDPFAAPSGFTEWAEQCAEANEPPPAYRPTRKQQRWGSTRHGWQRRPR